MDRDNAKTVRVIFVTTVLAILSMSCASTPSEGTDSAERIFDEDEVDTPARVVSCGGYFGARGRRIGVFVSVIVTPDGTVKQVGRVRRAGPNQRSNTQQDRMGIVREAIELAWLCLFEPAEIDNQPVTVRREVRFSL